MNSAFHAIDYAAINIFEHYEETVFKLIGKSWQNDFYHGMFSHSSLRCPTHGRIRKISLQTPSFWTGAEMIITKWFFLVKCDLTLQKDTHKKLPLERSPYKMLHGESFVGVSHWHRQVLYQKLGRSVIHLDLIRALKVS